jgi:hypothetical protein
MIAEGKTKAARRVLPMFPAVFAVLHRRCTEALKPREGWVFPANTNSGHVEEGSTKNQHIAAVKTAWAGHSIRGTP